MKLNYLKDPLIGAIAAGLLMVAVGVGFGWYNSANDFTSGALPQNLDLSRQLVLIASGLIVGTTALAVIRQNYTFALLNIMLASFMALVVFNTQIGISSTQEIFLAKPQIGLWITIGGAVVVGVSSLLMLIAGAPYAAIKPAASARSTTSSRSKQ